MSKLKWRHWPLDVCSRHLSVVSWLHGGPSVWGNTCRVDKVFIGSRLCNHDAAAVLPSSTHWSFWLHHNGDQLGKNISFFLCMKRCNLCYLCLDPDRQRERETDTDTKRERERDKPEADWLLLLGLWRSCFYFTSWVNSERWHFQPNESNDWYESTLWSLSKM